VSDLRVTIDYELRGRVYGDLLECFTETRPVEHDGSGLVTLPLPGVGAIIDFNGMHGRVVSRRGENLEWTVRCEPA
jgi:hypothetical protein